MTRVQAVTEVFDAIQQAKVNAPAFCTNFFPVQPKVQSWIDHGELFSDHRPGVAFFLRQDRDFWHLYFSSGDQQRLAEEVVSLEPLNRERVAMDVIGNQTALASLAAPLAGAGLRPYTRLQRLARAAKPGDPPASVSAGPVVEAQAKDLPAILALLERAFNRYADQLPTPYELEAALEARQILVVHAEDRLAALVFFETQGFTSSIRYWVVDEAFRSRRFGSALMTEYFARHPAVRRFILWVGVTNQNALDKYAHFGYAPDGLLDLVLVNQHIHS